MYYLRCGFTMFVVVRCSRYLFFVMQKTAYERRISDGSSDVCSSDLGVLGSKSSRRCMAQRLSQITRSPARHLWCQEKRSCAVWAQGVFSSSSDSSTGRPRIQACRATPITAWLTCSAKGIDDPQPLVERQSMQIGRAHV